MRKYLSQERPGGSFLIGYRGFERSSLTDRVGLEPTTVPQSGSEMSSPTMSAAAADPHCAHCGDVCSSESVLANGLIFCCAGCRSVYDILQQHDLCEYYGPEPVGVSMRSRRSTEEYAILDDKRIQSELLSFSSASRARITWTVPTLHCASCVWLLEQLSRLDSGILTSTVDIIRKTVAVDYDPRVTSLRNIAETLDSIGYAPLIRIDRNADANPRRDASSTRGLYSRIGLAGFATANTMLVAFAQYLAGAEAIDTLLANTFSIVAAILSVPVLLYSASPWFVAALASIRQRKISLDVPVAIGILALFVRSSVDIAWGRGEGFFDSFNALVFLLLIGRLFQQKAFDALSFDRSYRSFFPLSVRVFRTSNASENDTSSSDDRSSEDDRSSVAVVPIEEVVEGDILIIRNGEVIPCDSVLDSESAFVDYSFVTGEAVPVESVKGQILHAGGRVVGRAATLVAKKKVSHSELAHMWDRTWKRSQRPTFLTVSDSFGRWFTFTAIFVAVGGAILWAPGISSQPDWEMAFNVFTAVLIIACPCALTLSAPITLGTAMGRLGNLGIYLKNVGTLLELARISTVLFDKTGTLTRSGNRLEYHGQALTDEQWQGIRALASHSSHPVSRAIAENAGVPSVSDHTKATNVLEFIGQGISGSVSEMQITIGSLDFVISRMLNTQETETTEAYAKQSHTTHIGINGKYAGSITLQSELRPGVSAMIRALLHNGKKAQVVSGDGPRDSKLLVEGFGRENLTFNCRPEDKISRIEVLQAKDEVVLMVGDGLNDAGAMGAANAAIAVTEDTATLVPACDVIMRSNTVRAIPSLLDYSGRVKNVIIACFIISVVYNIGGLTLAVMGLLTPLVAAILMPVSSLTVIAVSVFGARLAIADVQRAITPETV